MTTLYYCEVCCKHHLEHKECQSAVQNGTVTVSGIALATLLGLTACGDKPSEMETSALYGVEVVDTAYWDGDDDGDGFSPADGDCDDDNADVNPDAEEIPGDDVDSNCNGEDDT